MSEERHQELLDDFDHYHQQLGWGIVVALAAFGTMIFCMVKDFPIGMIGGLVIHIWTLSKCEAAKQELDKIMWELDL